MYRYIYIPICLYNLNQKELGLYKIPENNKTNSNRLAIHLFLRYYCRKLFSTAHTIKLLTNTTTIPKKRYHLYIYLYSFFLFFFFNHHLLIINYHCLPLFLFFIDLLIIFFFKVSFKWNITKLLSRQSFKQ